MTTALERKPTVAAKSDVRVRLEVDRATDRIRVNDAATGAAALGVTILGYTFVAILLDQWLELARPLRVAGLTGLLTTCAAVAYYRIVQPLRRAVNPRYAARQIEATSPHAKNAVINWVDLRDHTLPDGVRAAVAAQAAGELAEADVTKATAPRQLTRLGTVAGVLAVALAMMLVVYKPAQFFSLLTRTFNPLTSTRIAPRTEITLTAPVNGDATVTTGEGLTVSVSIGGRLPDPDGPGRVRLLFRHNPDAAEYDEIPVQSGTDSGREFSLRVPEYIIQNGFWYKVAAGDAETPEYRVSVRNRPLFKGFEARYEYPEYLRIAPDVGYSPNLEAFRGTFVTLTAKTNRTVKSGRLRISGKPDALFGKVTGEGKNAIEFRLRLEESGSYQLSFSSTDDEPSDLTPAYPIVVIADKAPLVQITNPVEEEVRIPADGLLAVDGTIGDDFGIDRVALHARVIGSKNEPPVVLPAKNYRDHSFRRAADGSHPTSLEYKDSLALNDLKDMLGRPVPVKDGSVIEFWIEATDNCTEPAANIGKSKVYRVTLEKPADQPELKEQQRKEDAARQEADRQFRKQQDNQLEAEKRDPPPPPKRADGDSQPPADGQSAGDPAEGQQDQPQQSGDQTGRGSGDSGTQKAGDAQRSTPDGPSREQPDQTTNPKTDGDPKEQSGNATKPQSEGKPDDAKLQEQADRIQQALDEQTGDKNDNRGANAGKPSGQQPTAGDAPQTKPDDASRPPSDDPTKSRERSDANGQQSKPSADPKTDQPKTTDGSKSPPDGSGTDEKHPPDGQRPTDASRSGPGQPGDGEPQAGQQSGRPPERGELDRLFGRDGEKVPPPPETVERLKRDANDLNSPEQLKREQAEEKFDESLGEQERERLRQAAKDRQSDDLAKKKQAEEEVDELTKKAAKKEKANELAQHAEDLASPDDNRRETAERKIDQELGQKGREQLQEAMKDMKSGDPSRQKAGMDKLKDMAQQAGDNKHPTPEQMNELAEAAKDLNSDDPAKRQAAEKKLDQQLGQDARQELQQMANDLKSNDPAKRQAAEEKLKDLAKRNGGNQPSQEDVAQAAKEAEGLTSDDPTTREAAEEKFDKALGEQKRKELQQAMKDMEAGESPPQKQSAAKEKAEQLTKEAAGKPGPADDASRKRLDEAKDLASPDDAKREAAERKFDKEMGKPDREKLQQHAKDMQADDPAKRQEAADRAREQLGQPPVSDDNQKRENDLSKLAEKAKDLNSDDPAKREAAEKEIDDAIGKGQREKVQQLMKDLATDDPKTAETAKRNLEELARDAMKGAPDEDFNPNGRGGTPGEAAKPIDGDINDRLKSAELQLTQLEKGRYNEELQKRLGYNKAEYDEFVKSYAEMVNRLRGEVAEAAPKTATPSPATGPVTRVGESGASGFQPGGPTPAITGSGGGTAPPGFAEAQRRFAEEAAKRGRK